AVHFFDQMNGIIAGYHFMLSTKDGGEHWVPVNIPDSIAIVDMVFQKNGYGMGVGSLGSSPSVFITNDSGKTWEASPVEGVHRLSGVTLVNDSVAVVSATDSSSYDLYGSAHRTTDRGKTWTRVDS